MWMGKGEFLEGKAGGECGSVLQQQRENWEPSQGSLAGMVWAHHGGTDT